MPFTIEYYALSRDPEGAWVCAHCPRPRAPEFFVAIGRSRYASCREHIAIVLRASDQLEDELQDPAALEEMIAAKISELTEPPLGERPN